MNNNITEKYELKIKYDQFGNFVDKNYMDGSEIECISKFEKVCLQLKSNNIEKCTMIELGSNQADYSLLFRAIIDGVGVNKRCLNILLEPTPENMKRGQEHFLENKFDGIYESAGIGHYWCWNTRWHDHSIPSYTIDELMEKYGIESLDVLHSDIDGNEIRLLETSKSAFKEKKINYIFILTHGEWTEEETSYKSEIIKHGENRHAVCKEFLLKCGYNLIHESPSGTVGHDGLLVFGKN